MQVGYHLATIDPKSHLEITMRDGPNPWFTMNLHYCFFVLPRCSYWRSMIFAWPWICMVLNYGQWVMTSFVPRGPGKISLGFRVPTQESHGELWGSCEMDRKSQQHCACRSGWCFTGFGVSWSWKTLWQEGKKSWRALRGDDFLVCFVFFWWFWCVLVFFCNHLNL